MRAFTNLSMNYFGMDSFDLEGMYSHIFFSVLKIGDIPILFQVNDSKDWYEEITDIKQRLRIQYAFDDENVNGLKVLGRVLDEILDGTIEHNGKAEIMWGNYYG